MNQIQSEIIINAPIELIWETLLDFKSYPSWNPFISKIDGMPTLGAKLAVTIQPKDQKPMIIKTKILTISDYHFSWISSLLAKSIFNGVHHFKLQQESTNQVKFIHFENFSGILHKPILAKIQESTSIGFNSMNLTLKNLCEDKFKQKITTN